MRLTFSDWLSLAGLVLGIAFGVLSMGLFTQPTVVRATVAILGALLCLLSLILFWVANGAEWTVQRSSVQLIIHDVSGKRATLRKTVTLRCNKPRGASIYTHRNISPDGAVEFRCDEGVTFNADKEAGDHHVEVRFRAPVGFLNVVETWLEITCRDSFLEPEESFTLVIDSHIKEAGVMIEFPDERPARAPRAVFSSNGHTGVLEFTHRDGKLTWQSTGRLMGIRRGEYKFSWLW